jgi:hypothetical protein
MRAGEAMETPLREVCFGIPILKLLIQSDQNKEPRVHRREMEWTPVHFLPC